MTAKTYAMDAKLLFMFSLSLANFAKTLLALRLK